MSQICVIDTGTSNIKSIVNAITHLGFEPKVVNKDHEIIKAKCIILPGVGSFDKVMKSIKAHNLVQPLNNAVIKNKIPILGICIGMQILFNLSDEGKEVGLNLIDGNIKKLIYKKETFHKVPNNGFREVFFSPSNPLISKEIQKEHLYFNHSFGLLSKEFKYKHDVFIHNNQFVASFNHKNIFGMQFHPEKSQQFGLFLLKNFIQISLNLSK